MSLLLQYQDQVARPRHPVLPGAGMENGYENSWWTQLGNIYGHSYVYPNQMAFTAGWNGIYSHEMLSFHSYVNIYQALIISQYSSCCYQISVNSIYPQCEPVIICETMCKPQAIDKKN